MNITHCLQLSLHGNENYAFLGDLVAFDGDLITFVVEAAFADFFGRRTGFMLGKTPPCAIVTPLSSFPSSSSFLTANRTWRGMIRFFLLSLAALPASSRTWLMRHAHQSKLFGYMQCNTPILSTVLYVSQSINVVYMHMIGLGLCYVRCQ